MFKAVHVRNQKAEIGPEKQVFKTGITFEKPTHVNRKFTYKELTLVLGIVVALIIVFAWWFTQDIPAGHAIGTQDSPIPSLGALTTKLLQKATTALFFL